MTQKERSARHYKNRKENGLCPRCGNLLDREGYYCSKCLREVNAYQRESREFYRKNHICTVCGKFKVPGNERICPECRVKRNKYRKPLSQEDKDNIKERKKSLYWQRKGQGICVSCGKRKAMSGKVSCGICLEKDAEKKRKARFNKQNVREYRKENHLCYYCGNEIDIDKGQVCNKCLERCRQNGFKSSRGNKFWKQENMLIFRNGGRK